jgi:integral membrane protein (TIGR01906 family)
MSSTTSHVDSIARPTRRPAALARWLQVTLVILMPVVLILGAVRLLATDQYLAIEYNRSDFPPDGFGFDYADRLNFASATVRYMRDGLSLTTLAELRWQNQPLYNDRELGHMQDVQNVYQAAALVWLLALTIVLLVALALGWRRENRPALAVGLKRGGLLTAGLVGGVGLLAVIGWQFWFDTFHRLFFAPGTWLFNASDALIRLVPEKFWFDTALSLAGLSLIGGLLVALIGWLMARHFHTSSSIDGVAP